MNNSDIQDFNFPDMKGFEKKDFPLLQFKFNEDGTFSGYASKFDVVDSYGDMVMKGAFKRTLRNKKQFPLCWSHMITEPVGSITGKEDDTGLFVRGKMTKGVQRASELHELMKDDVVGSLSIGYQVLKEENDNENGTRKLLEINLWEVSLCLFGACPGAEVTEVKAIRPEELKPFPNEHACVLTSVDKYDKFRRGNRKHEGKEYSIIYGKVKGEDKWEDHSFRYPKDEWTAAEAKAYCKDHDGTFEAAKCEHCRATLDALSAGDPDASTPQAGDSQDKSNPDILHLLDSMKFKL